MGRPRGRRRSREAAALAARLHEVSAGIAVGVALMKGALEQDGAAREYFERGLAAFDASLVQLRALAVDPLLRSDRPRNLRAELANEARIAGVEMVVEIFGDPAWLNHDEVELIWLAGREAVRNVMRHAGSTRCRAVLDVSECPVSFSVRDWGAGIGRGHPAGHGLEALRELAESMGWRLEVRSLPGLGTELLLVGRACPGEAHQVPRSGVAEESLRSRRRVARGRPIRASGQQIRKI